MCRVVAVLTFACALLACSAPGEDLGAAPASVIGGSEARDPGVVALFDSDGRFICSGALISSRIVLTAGHCTMSPPPVEVLFSDTIRHLGARVRVQKIVVHPEFVSSDFRHADLALLVLRERARVPSLTWNAAGLPEDFVDREVRVVGFGLQSQGGITGEKMTVSIAIDRLVGEREYEYAGATCGGDSGGPQLLDEAGDELLVGVTSYARGGCGGEAGAHRVDVHAGWIQGVLDEEDPPSCERDERCVTGCADADPDCPCAADGFCVALCLDPGSDPDCPLVCSPGNECSTTCPLPDADCGDPCLAEGHCLRDCPVRDPDCPAQLPAGSPCATTFDCLPGTVCLADLPGQASICEPVCEADDVCPAGRECVETANGFACLSPRLVIDVRSSSACRAAPGGRGGHVAQILVLSGLLVLLRGRRRRIG
jgi:V8-like Glu-specific endopeptidase